MKCATEGCSRDAHKRCEECSRNYCEAHILTCSECRALVCAQCRFEHDRDNLAHEEGTPNA